MGFRFNTYGAVFPAKVIGNRFIVSKLNKEFEAEEYLGESDWSMIVPLSPNAVVGAVKDQDGYVYTLCRHGNRIHIDRSDYGFIRTVQLRSNILIHLTHVGYYFRDRDSIKRIYQEFHTRDWVHVENMSVSFDVGELGIHLTPVQEKGEDEILDTMIHKVSREKNKILLKVNGYWKIVDPVEVYKNEYASEVIDYGK